MTEAVLIIVAVIAAVFASVIFGKELDENEKKDIAKEKFEDSQKTNEWEKI
ncbi:hypothetical protein IGI84_001211 [Enterococcus sp. DIV0008]|uniref:hypothetical protein n=1 Tax=unclassified Enterococcus TaxID=2608891 RepID=UPI003D30164D